MSQFSNHSGENNKSTENIHNGHVENNHRDTNIVENTSPTEFSDIAKSDNSVITNNDESLDSQLAEFPNYESLDPQTKIHLKQFLSNYQSQWYQEKKTLLKLIKDRNDEKNNVINELSVLKPYLEKVSRQRNDYYEELITVRDENKVVKSTDNEMNRIISSLEKKVDTLSKELMTERNMVLDSERNSKLKSQKQETTILSLKDQNKLKDYEIKTLDQSVHSLNEQIHSHLKHINNLETTIKENQNQYEIDIALQQKITSSQEKQIHSLNSQLSKYQRSESYFNEMDKLIQNNHTLKEENTRLTNIINSNNVASLYVQELEQLKKDLEYANSCKTDLESQVERYINDLESQLPTIENFKGEIQSLNNKLKDSKLLIEHKSQELATKQIQLEESNNHIVELNNQINTLQRTNTDLAHQLQYILINLSICNNTNSPILSEKQLIFLKRLISSTTNDQDTCDQENIDLMDSQHIISEELIKFKDIIDLQKRNMQLVNTIRSLSDKLESLEAEKKANKDNFQIINDAKSALLKLQSYTNELEVRIEDLNQQINSQVDTIQGQNIKNQELKEKLMKLQNFETLQKELQNTIDNNLAKIKSLNEQIRNLEIKNNELILDNKKTESSNMLLQDRIKILENLLEVAKQEISHSKFRVQSLNSLLLETEREVISYKKEHNDCNRLKNSLNHDIDLKAMEIKKLNLAAEIMKKREKQSNETINSYEAELMSLKSKISNNDIVITNLKQDRDQLELLNKKLIEELNNRNFLNFNEISNQYNNLKWYQKNIDLLKTEKQQLSRCINEKNNTINELEGSVTSIKYELEKSNIASEMKERLSREEIVTLNQKISTYRQKETTLTNELNTLKQWKSENEGKFNELHNKLSDMENDYAKKIMALDRDMSMKNDEINSLQAKNDSLLQMQKEVEAKTNELLSKIKDLCNEKEDLLKTIKSNKLEKDSLFQKIIHLEESYNNEVSNKNLSTKETVELKNEIEEYKLKLEKVQHTVDESSRILREKEAAWNQEKSKYQREISRTTSLSTPNHIDQNQKHLTEQANGISNQIDTSVFAKLVEEKEALWKQLVSSQHEEKLLRNTLANTREQLKALSSDMEKINKMDVVLHGSKSQISSSDTEQLTSQLEEYKQKCLDAEDRFNRLKKQAHEKLNQSKGAINSLTTEVNKLKTYNSELEEHLKVSESKINILESIVKEGEGDKATIANLQRELTSVLEKSKDLETKLNENIRASDSMTRELNQKIQSLNAELNTLKEEAHLNEKDTISNTVESMKKTFEEEKIQFMNNLKGEYEEKFSELKKSIPLTISQDKLKEDIEKDLKDKYMKLTETKLEALKKNYEEDLQKVRNKAFEEGKQQVLMKATLLERKISKLESQLKDESSKKEIKEVLPYSSTIEKTPETVNINKSSPLATIVNNSTSSTAKSTFPLSFQSSTSSINPFTSPLDKKIFTSSAGNTISTIKPAFSLQLMDSTISDTDTPETTKSSSLDESNNTNNSLKRSSADEPSLDNIINKKIKEEHRETEQEGSDAKKINSKENV